MMHQCIAEGYVLKTNLKSTVAGLALLMVTGFVTGASAQNANEAGQTPPPANESGQTPPAEVKPPEPVKPPECISDNSSFWTTGKTKGFRVSLTNSCEKRMRCTVNAYIVTSHGPFKGKAKLMLGPKSNIKTATKTHMFDLKATGGMANLSRDCKAI